MVCQIKEGTVSSLEFWFFIKLLEKVLISAINESEDPPLLILDNARVHNSKLTTLFMHSCKLQTKFLPPYWLEIAPVERIFGAVNSKMRSIKFTSDVDFSKEIWAEFDSKIAKLFYEFDMVRSMDQGYWRMTTHD